MKKYSDKLYCFSPPVMVATFLAEAVMLGYTVMRHKTSSYVRIIGSILMCLAIFQFAEYNVCTGGGSAAVTWSRLGYIAITLLPALGIQLVLTIAGKVWRPLVVGTYASAAAWSALFVRPETFNNHACTGNYVIFNLSGNLGGYYFIYYYLLMFLGMALCIYFSNHISALARKALLWQLTGYLVFILPTAVTNTISPATIQGLPSIMCGFAVIYAFILVFAIAPALKERESVAALDRQYK